MKEQRILLVDADGDSEGIVSEADALTGRDVLVAKTSRDAFRILGDQIQRRDLVIVDARRRKEHGRRVAGDYRRSPGSRLSTGHDFQTLGSDR